MTEQVLVESGIPAMIQTSDSNRATASSAFSERVLDWLAFFLADVADGLGPFLVIDLTTRRSWTATQAGAAMAALLVGTVVSQTLTGAWIDRTEMKRLGISIAALVVAVASLGLYYINSVPTVIGLQVAIGVAVTVFAPALAAISLGIVGRHRFAARAGRNEAFFHAGNVVAATFALLASQYYGTIGVFYASAVMAVLSAICVQFIREKDIDHHLARGADSEAPHSDQHELAEQSIISPWKLLQDQRLLWIIASVVLFHFANAAMLPLVGQKIGHASNPTDASSLMAMCIIVAQVTMVPVALIASQRAMVSRRSVFLVALAVLPVRGVLYTLTESHLLLIAIQILDGIAAGIFGVVALLMVADVTRGTGRFNLAQGMMATGIGLGAALSQLVTGLIVDFTNYNAGFLFLSAIAVLSLVVFTLKVPETAS